MVDALIQRGSLDRAGAARAARASEELGEQLDRAICRLGLAPETEIADAWATLTGLPRLPQGALPAMDAGLTLAFLQRRRAAPLQSPDDDAIALAVADPSDEYVVRAVRYRVKRPVKLFIATETEIARLLSGLDGGRAQNEVDAQEALTDIDAERLRDLASGAPVIRWVNTLFAEAVAAGASDIHLEPGPGGLSVRLRVDGALRPSDPAPPDLAAAVVPRVKIMAKLDVAERRLPQDGRLTALSGGRAIDVRVATAPTHGGEAAVLRLFDTAAVGARLDELGFSEANLRAFRQALSRPYGLVLVTGPTGAGKTTSLYAALAECMSAERKLITVEDPVERKLDGVTQIQVKPGIGLTFGAALRSLLRCDPDVVLVGEIRDAETAQIAAEAALTGHLVLATLHANSAAGAVTRLLEMGVADYLIAATLSGVMAQRLVRKLCPACAEPQAPSPALLRTLGAPADSVGDFAVARGCNACKGVGYRGRAAVSEFLAVTDDIASLILAGAGEGAIAAQARQNGALPLSSDALAKARSGLTSLEEAVRACRVS